METKRKVGRPSHQPSEKDRKVVEALVGFGIPEPKICDVLNITPPTLRLHYPDEIKRGKSVVEAQLISNLMRLAGGDGGTALKATMFALQTRFGWSMYAPAPVDITPQLGKKELANLEAETAHEESSWADLVH